MMTSLQKQFLELHLTFLHSCRVCQRHVLLLLLKKRPQRAREVGKRGDAFHNMHTLDNLHAFLPSFYAL